MDYLNNHDSEAQALDSLQQNEGDTPLTPITDAIPTASDQIEESIQEAMAEADDDDTDDDDERDTENEEMDDDSSSPIQEG
jgi:hypothetical protein